MKKIVFLLFLIFNAFINIEAQSNVSGFVELNYNTFSHSKLKTFQEQLLNDINQVNLKINDDFGSNIGYTIGVKVENIDTQFFASYNSTGGKISYSDFSGIIRITQLLQAYTLGGEYQIKLTQENKREMFYLGTRGFINYNKLDLKTYSKIADNTSNESIEFNSVDFGLGIRLLYELPVSIVKIRFNIGYDLVFGGDFKFKENNDFSLEDNKGNTIKSGWSGFRTGIGIVVPF